MSNLAGVLTAIKEAETELAQTFIDAVREAERDARKYKADEPSSLLLRGRYAMAGEILNTLLTICVKRHILVRDNDTAKGESNG